MPSSWAAVRDRLGPDKEPGALDLVVQMQGDFPVFQHKVGLQKSQQRLHNPPGPAVVNRRVRRVRLSPRQPQTELVHPQRPAGICPPPP